MGRMAQETGGQNQNRSTDQLMDIVTYYIMTQFNVRDILPRRVNPSTTNLL